jgi:hypothetical protein
MHVWITYIGIAATGWISPDMSEPISPVRENVAGQHAYSSQSNGQAGHLRQPGPQAGGARPPARPANATFRRPSRMPFAPTDPRALADDNIPLPPTQNETEYLPSAGNGGPQRYNSPAIVVSNAGNRSGAQKSFDHYNPNPSASPYMMLNASSANGTVNTYTAYVRPAEEQQRANQEEERAMSNLEGVAQPGPIPSYPPAFLNYGTYYPNYAGGR